MKFLNLTIESAFLAAGLCLATSEGLATIEDQAQLQTSRFAEEDSFEVVGESAHSLYSMFKDFGFNEIEEGPSTTIVSATRVHSTIALNHHSGSNEEPLLSFSSFFDVYNSSGSGTSSIHEIEGSQSANFYRLLKSIGAPEQSVRFGKKKISLRQITCFRVRPEHSEGVDNFNCIVHRRYVQRDARMEENGAGISKGHDGP